MKKSLLTTTAALLACTTAFSAQLLNSGSFESPRVKERLQKNKGGSPTVGASSNWIRFDTKVGDEGGKLIAGLTNEMARTGRQSLFIQFDKLKAPKQGAELESGLISILPGKPYHVAIWGRLNKKTPLTIDQRLPYLKLFVYFFQSDKETECSEPVMRLQPMPGSKNRPPLFTTGKWSEYFTDVNAPEDAAFLKLMWRWDTPPDEGMTNGVIYFDDATVSGEPGPVQAPEELDDEEMAEDAAKPADATAQPAPADEKAKPAPAPKKP